MSEEKADFRTTVVAHSVGLPAFHHKTREAALGPALGSCPDSNTGDAKADFEILCSLLCFSDGFLPPKKNIILSIPSDRTVAACT